MRYGESNPADIILKTKRLKQSSRVMTRTIVMTALHINFPVLIVRLPCSPTTTAALDLHLCPYKNSRRRGLTMVHVTVRAKKEGGEAIFHHKYQICSPVGSISTRACAAATASPHPQLVYESKVHSSFPNTLFHHQ
jgi:hypothetical protein